MNTHHAWILFAAALLGSACSSSNDNTDAGTIVIDVARPDTGGTTDAGNTTDTPATTDTGTPSDTPIATDVGVDAGVPSDVATDAATDAAGRYVDGCYVGTPVQMTDFLNRCGGAVAFPARAARGSRLLPDGGVQPLPM